MNVRVVFKAILHFSTFSPATVLISCRAAREKGRVCISGFTSAHAKCCSVSDCLCVPRDGLTMLIAVQNRHKGKGGP